MTTRPAYKKRLQQHLKETKNNARQVERRIKKLDGATLLQTATARGTEAVSRGTALTKGPLHAVRGTGEEEMQLKNAITEHSEEGEEIARLEGLRRLALGPLRSPGRPRHIRICSSALSQAAMRDGLGEAGSRF
jgi:hypothetical protein